jgi:hypothetical protein
MQSRAERNVTEPWSGPVVLWQVVHERPRCVACEKSSVSRAIVTRLVSAGGCCEVPCASSSTVTAIAASPDIARRPTRRGPLDDVLERGNGFRGARLKMFW